MSRLRAIVVDDELLAREGLSADLTALDVDVVATCADGYSARTAIVDLRPDLLFLDVEMPEVDGFALLEGLEPEDVPPAVVFATAYDQHALRAFEARALDYLLKPFAPARLREAVERAQRRVEEARALRDATDAAQSETP
ncbi:MAG: response regulator receiver, partial [Gemmatimonadetes bacterium]|nr:response regulator receiver [Gemmatimonadota bacterium]